MTLTPAPCSTSAVPIRESLAYGLLTSVLINAVQEQQGVIEAQQKEIEQLKAQLENPQSSFEKRLSQIEELLQQTADMGQNK